MDPQMEPNQDPQMDQPPHPAEDPTSNAVPTGRRAARRWPWVAGAAAVAAVAAVAFGVFGVHTLFFDETVAEEGPVFASGAELPDSVDEEPGTGEEPGATSEVPGTAPDAEADAPTTTAPPAVATITTVASGTFSAVDHPGEGTVNILTDGTQTFVRFEDDFGTDNGPDLYAVAYVGGERVELAVLKGNEGSQNYELPAEVDPATVTKIAVWCKRFDSTFTEAVLG